MMAWRLVRQPNGKLARFSEIVDNFTHFDMSDDEAFKLCHDAAGLDVAQAKIERADAEPERFDEAIEIIKMVHGDDVAQNRRTCLS